MTAIDLGLLLLRLWAGVVMLSHGVNHGRSLDGTTRWFASRGFASPRMNALLATGSEIALGLALIAGFLTAPAAAGVIATMFAAFWSVHRYAGFFVFRRPDEGYEYVATLTVIAIVLAVAGPGAASVDHAIGIADDLDEWIGAAIAAAGLLLAMGQLAVLWRKPANDGQGG